MSRLSCSLSSTFQLAFAFLGLAVPLAFLFDLSREILLDLAFTTFNFPLSYFGALLRLSQRTLRRRLNINPTQVPGPHRHTSHVLTELSPSVPSSPKSKAHVSTLPFQRRSNSDSIISIPSPSSPSRVTLLLPSVTSVVSSHTNSKQLPQLSATLLIIITCGTFVAFSLLAVTCYCCAGCRKRRNSIEMEKRREKERNLGVADDLESGGKTRKGIIRGPDYEAGTDSPSAFEFSPPSPTWRPTMPSLAHVSSNISAGSSTYGSGGNALASGRGEILSGEAIMQEREPNRRKVYGGGGWAAQSRQGQMPSSSTSVPAAHSLSVSVAARGMAAQPGGSNSHRLQHPYAQAHAFRGRVGAGIGTGVGTSMNRGVGMPDAPPLPVHAPKIYRPPAYHRPSRIMPVPMPTQPSIQPAIHSPATSWTNLAPAASTSATRSEPKVKREREDPKKKRGGVVHVLLNSNPKPDPQNSKPARVCVAVPQIKVHFAHDGSSETETGTESYLGDANANTSTLTGARVQAQVQRSNSLTSQNQSQSGRRPLPGSGLGISTINLIGSTPGSGSVGGGSITRASTTERSRRATTITQAPASSCPSPSSPATPSEEDVRLAYRASTISVILEPGPSKSRRDSLKKGVGAGSGTGAVTAAKIDDSSSRTTTETNVSKRKISSTDKRKSRFYNSGTTKMAVSDLQLQPPSASEAHQGARRRSRNVRPSSSEISCRRSNLNADANINSSKRQALGVGAVDQAIKSELHCMRSLGSESFDSLIAYLDETVDPDEGEGNIRNKMRDARNSVRKGKQTSTVEAGQTKSKKASVAVEEVEASNARVTREETVRVDERAYEAWVGSLDASPSVLKLAHVELDPYATSVRSRRRSRSAGAGDARRTNRNQPGEKTRADVSKVEREAGGDSRMPLRERNTNIEPEPRSRRKHTRNKSEGSCLLESTKNLNTNASRDTDAVQERGKVGMHVRTLRARSASLKVKSQTRVAIAEDNCTGTGIGARDSGYLAAAAVDSSRPRSQTLALAKPNKVASSKTDSAKGKTTATVCDQSRETLARLPSFSIPSTATQLYEAFPASLSDACSASSSSGSLALADSGLDLKSDALKQSPESVQISTHSVSASTPAVTSKVTRRTRPTSGHGTTVRASAVSFSSSKVAAVPVPATSSSSRRNSRISNPNRNAEAKAKVVEKAVSSAAYIARCAPTPHLESAALLSSFLSPGASPNPDPPLLMTSRHLPGYELELERERELGHQNLNSTSRSRRSRSRYSVHSMSSMGSTESGESASSVWGRRSEWGRESLTPRFDHLRAVLEGDRGGMGPPPIPSLASGVMRQSGRRDRDLEFGT